RGNTSASIGVSAQPVKLPNFMVPNLSQVVVGSVRKLGPKFDQDGISVFVEPAVDSRLARLAVGLEKHLVFNTVGVQERAWLRAASTRHGSHHLLDSAQCRLTARGLVKNFQLLSELRAARTSEP